VKNKKENKIISRSRDITLLLFLKRLKRQNKSTSFDVLLFIL